jgi:hypothetical protein
MFGLFKKKTEREKIQEQYSKMMDEAFKLSHTDRKASDNKYAEAEQLIKRLRTLPE